MHVVNRHKHTLEFSLCLPMDSQIISVSADQADGANRLCPLISNY